MARVLAVVADLMLASRVEGSLSAAGHKVSVAASLPAEVDVDLIVCDLDAVDATALGALGDAAAAAPLQVDGIAVGHPSHTLRRPVLKSLNATYMLCTRLRTTWYFLIATSGTCTGSSMSSRCAAL